MAIVLPRRLPVTTLPAGTTLWRVHREEHVPLWFGPAPGRRPRGRFDAPGGEFGVCYFGQSIGVAVLEALVRGSRRLLARADLEARVASPVVTRESMRFLQFEGPGLARLGIGAEQAHAATYGDCQQMAADLMQSPPDIDGVQYRSRWDNSLLCWAVFDRAENLLEPPEGPELLQDLVPGSDPLSQALRLSDPAVIGPTLDRYELEIV